VRGHRVLAEALAEVTRGALGHAARVDEDQRGAMQQHQLGHARIDLVPLLVGHHRAQRLRRQLEGEVAFLGIADVDDLAVGHAAMHVPRAHEEARDLFDGLLRGRQADARERPAAQRLQALQREREVAAALAGGDGMDLVDDHRAHRRQHAPARGRAEQHVERLGRGHEDVRRLAQVLLAVPGGGVAGAHGAADVHVRQAQHRQLGTDARQRRLEVQADVVGQRLERRDVHHCGLVGQAAGCQALAHQPVERGKESGQGLARSGRSRDQRVAPGTDGRPGGFLRLGGSGKAAAEPAADGRVEIGERHGLRAGEGGRTAAAAEACYAAAAKSAIPEKSGLRRGSRPPARAWVLPAAAQKTRDLASP
jgi:hypothetical protein